MNDNKLEQMQEELEKVCQSVILSVNQKRLLADELSTLKEAIMNGTTERDSSDIRECYGKIIDILFELELGVCDRKDIQKVVSHMFKFLDL